MVCYGNICRSPMAEALLQHALDQRLGPDGGWVVTSAGTGAVEGYTISRHGIAAMAKRGLDVSKHRARPVTAALVNRVDRIVCMTRSHRDAVLAMAPSAKDKVFTLGADVPDPIGGTADDYERVARLLEPRIDALADEIAAGARARA
jgi:protein-tyrosine phosphatase